MVGWLNGVSEVADVFRMEEKDWKKVYLSRTEEADIGKIKWSFEITNSNKVFDTVEMYFDHTLYQNGNIQVLLSGDTGKDILLPDEKNLTTKTLSGSCKLEISATLTGGKGDIAWQHAQLFRQETTSEEPEFIKVFGVFGGESFKFC
ncbi:PNGase C-terminal domain, mannose-binding module PAW [Popillia japonica]|uniref:PNGase C-terminal domain, mannose-binding module PAW n=1 Tax=Popillia japonica TaxID=7064 RepID=A0AAW1L5K5_POPJA